MDTFSVFPAMTSSTSFLRSFLGFWNTAFFFSLRGHSSPLQAPSFILTCCVLWARDQSWVIILKSKFLTWLLGRITWRTFRNFTAAPQNLWRRGQASICCGLVLFKSSQCAAKLHCETHSPCDLIYYLVDYKRMTPNLISIPRFFY